MPFSNELGMRVFDPREGEQYGLQVGQMFNQAMQNAQNRAQRQQEIGIDQQRLKMLQDEVSQKAKATQLKQLGMAELQAEVDKGTPFRDAFFKVAPKLFSDNPQQLATALHQEAMDRANDTYKLELMTNKKDILELQLDKAEDARTKDALQQQINLLNTVIGQKRADEMERHNRAMEARPTTAETKLPETTKIKLESKLSELRSVNKEIEVFQKNNVVTDITNPPQAYMVLRNRQSRLQREIDGLSRDQGAKTESQTTTSPQTTEPQQKGAELRLGTLIQQGGKKYRYQGGDVNDPASYVEVK